MPSWVLPTVLSISILLQAASAFVALRMVKVSGFYKPWIFISLAIFLMTLRRIISFRTMILAARFPDTALIPELTALLISTLMLTGLITFRPVFREIRLMAQMSKEQIEKQKLLIRESNHRIKNNLHLVSSLINLKNDTLNGTFDLSDLSGQIEAVGKVHEQLYTCPDFTKVDIREYLGDIAQGILVHFGAGRITLHCEIAPVKVEAKQALNLGLMVNEIVTNAVKYGQTPEGETLLTISFQEVQDSGDFLLVVENSGKPFPEEIDIDCPKTLGLQLIQGLVSQLQGEMELRKAPHPRYSITIPGGVLLAKAG